MTFTKNYIHKHRYQNNAIRFRKLCEEGERYLELGSCTLKLRKSKLLERFQTMKKQ